MDTARSWHLLPTSLNTSISDTAIQPLSLAIFTMPNQSSPPVAETDLVQVSARDGVNLSGNLADLSQYF